MKNKLSAIFYIMLGFAVGYLLDTLRRENQQSPAETSGDVDNNVMEDSQNLEAFQFAPEQAESVVSASATAEESDSAESLQLINGIGPAYAKRLFESGIHSISQLAQTDVGTLANISNARSRSQVEGWVVQAAELLNK